MSVAILKKKMIICLCLVEFNVILWYEMKNKWWVLFSCSSNKYFNFLKIFLKRYQVSFLVWGIKNINNMAIKSKRKEKKNHKDKYLVGFKNIKIKNNCLFCWSNCTLIFFSQYRYTVWLFSQTVFLFQHYVNFKKTQNSNRD